MRNYVSMNLQKSSYFILFLHKYVEHLKSHFEKNVFSNPLMHHYCSSIHSCVSI